MRVLTRFAKDRLRGRERNVPYTHVSVDAVYFIVCNPVPGEYVPATTIIESLLWTPTLWPMLAENLPHVGPGADVAGVNPVPVQM